MAGGGWIVVSDISRLNSPSSCDASSLCQTFGNQTPTEVSIQLYICTILVLFGIVLISKAKGGRVGFSKWMIVTTVPFATVDLAYRMLTVTNTKGIVQLSEISQGDLEIDILYDVIFLAIGIGLWLLARYQKREQKGGQPKQQPQTVRVQSERTDRKRIDP
jgi:preprotein translocase subunit SecG